MGDLVKSEDNCDVIKEENEDVQPSVECEKNEPMKEDIIKEEKNEKVDVEEKNGVIEVGENVDEDKIHEDKKVAIKSEIENMDIDNDDQVESLKQKSEETFRAETTESHSRTPSMTPQDEKSSTNEESPLDDILKPDPVSISDLYTSPNFAEIFVFYNTFSSILRLKPVTFKLMERILTNFDDKGKVDNELINMQITLIRRAGNPAAKPEKFEGAIFKLAQYYPILQSVSAELEEVKHYSLLSIQSKLFLWKILCLAQFDYNTKFKEAVSNTLEFQEYSFKPMGYDQDGRRYYGVQDSDDDIRIFREDIFVKNEESGIFEEYLDEDKGEWKVVVKDDKDLENLIKELKESLNIDEVKEENSKEEVKEEGNGEENKVEFVKQLKKHCIFSDYISSQIIDQKKKNKIDKKAQRKNKKSAVEKETVGEDNVIEEEGNPDEPGPSVKELPSRSARLSAVKALSAELENEAEDSQDDEDIPDDGDDDDEYKSSVVRKPGKRGRKKSVKKALSKSTTPEVEEEVEDEEDVSEEEQEEVKERKQANLESVCNVCLKSKDQNLLLICDKCDKICIHIYCCKPKLYTIPEDDWFCPQCHQKDLISKLEVLQKEYAIRNEMKVKEEERKCKAAEALKRELALINVNLNGITPLALSRRGPPPRKNESKINDENSEDISDDDGTTRKSKKIAMKKVCRNSRKRSDFDFDVGPTIAEARSRRSTRNVDYRFKDYDEQIDDIVGEKLEDEEEEEETKVQAGPRRRKKKDDDDDFELDEASEIEEDDEDAYIPSSGFGSSRRGRGRRGSDEDFINDGSDSDYNPGSSKRRSKRVAPKRGPGRRRRNNYMSDEDDDDEISNDDSSPEYSGNRSRGGRGRKRKATKNDSDFYDSDFEVTTTGRHVRKAAKVVYKEDSLSDEDSNAGSKSNSRLSNRILPLGSIQRRRPKREDDDEFKIDDDDSLGHKSSSIPTPPPNVPILIPRPVPKKLPPINPIKSPLKLSMDVVCRPPPRRNNSSSPIDSTQPSPSIPVTVTTQPNPPNGNTTNNLPPPNKTTTVYVTKPMLPQQINTTSPRINQVIMPQPAYIVQQPMMPQNIQVISSPYSNNQASMQPSGYAISQSPIVYQNSQNWAPPAWQPGIPQTNPQIIYHVNGAPPQMYQPIPQPQVVMNSDTQEGDRNNLISGALGSDLTSL
uniref:PHD-type domain-containing protein n=1 Tax=Parastrongyloides trichosuri TaxID=131310 RepID=A0A0N4ZGK8_PARTI